MWPFSKSIEDVLNATKSVRVMGVRFKIKKIDMSNLLDGSKVLLQSYDTYKLGNASLDAQATSVEKVKTHFRDVFMSSVVYPKLKRKESEEGLLVDNLFTDWAFANALYAEVVAYTYGKKNIKPSI